MFHFIFFEFHKIVLIPQIVLWFLPFRLFCSIFELFVCERSKKSSNDPDSAKILILACCGNFFNHKKQNLASTTEMLFSSFFFQLIITFLFKKMWLLIEIFRESI